MTAATEVPPAPDASATVATAPAPPAPKVVAAVDPAALAPMAPAALDNSALAVVEPAAPAPAAPALVAMGQVSPAPQALLAPQTADAAPATAAAPAEQDVAPQPAVPDQKLAQVTPDAPASGPLPDVPAATDLPPSLAGLEPALTTPEADGIPATTDPAPPEPEGTHDALLAPGQASGQSEATRLPQIAPAVDPAVVAEAPAPVAPPPGEVAPKGGRTSTFTDKAPSTLPPVKSLTDKVPTTLPAAVPGVQADKLPQIGVAAAVVAAPVAAKPISQFARKFDGAQGKPMFVILLHDVGSAGMSRDALAKLPFPVSFVVDPLATDAKAAQAAYRAAGQEVLTLANGIPPGATAGDVATTFQTLAAILPDSVALIDEDLGGFQDNRPLATLVLPVVQDQGRGLVTYDRGLNAADQIARRNGVPSAVIFRRLDGAGEGRDVIRRYLDRAAFKAAQEGQVVVIGDTRAETVAAILEWTVEGRAASVTLAPVTAVLARP